MSSKLTTRKNRSSSRTDLKNLLRGYFLSGGAKSVHAINVGRQLLGSDSYPYLLRLYSIYSRPATHHILTGRTSSELIFSPESPAVGISIEREISWVVSILERHANLLSGFRMLADNLQTNVLGEDPSNLEAIFDKIEEDTGASLWLINAKIACFQLHFGLEKQKQYVAGIMNRAPDRFAAFAAYYISERNEDTVSPARFAQRMRRHIGSINLPEGLADYLSYVLIDDLPSSNDRLGGILRASAEVSVIDLLETFVSITHYLLSYKLVAGQLRLTIKRALDRLSHINDFRLRKLSLVVDESVENEEQLPLPYMNVDDETLRGNFDVAEQLAQERLEIDPANVAVALARARALTHLGKCHNLGTTLLDKITRDAFNLYSKNSEYQKSLVQLSRWAVNFKWASWSCFIKQIVLQEESKDPSLLPESLKVLLLASPFLNPLETLAFNQTFRDKYFNACLNRLGAVPCLTYQDVVMNGSNDSEDLEKGFWRLAFASRQLYEKNFTEVLASSKPLLDHQSQLVRNTANFYLLHAQLELGLLGDAIETIVNCYKSLPEMINALPLERTFRGRKYWEYKPYRNRLTTTIALDLYLDTTEDEDQQRNLRSALHDVVRLNGAEKPSDLLKSLGGFDQEELFHFLFNVCSTDNMRSCDEFDSTRSLYEERTAISSALADLHPENSEAYQNEILFCGKAIKIQDGLRLFDESRVNVNLSGLSRWAIRELKESFDRYLVLVSAGVTSASENLDFDKAVQRFLTVRQPLPQDYFELPNGEGDNLLIEIVDSLRFQFLNHPLHGLDSFLSSRIRHGSLSGFLRGPVEEYKLISSRDREGTPYKQNNSWNNLHELLLPEESMRLNTIFIEFSEEYDQTIKKIVDGWMHVRSMEHPEGIFDLELDGLMVRHLKSVVHDRRDLSDVVDSALEFFSALLPVPLSEMRDKIDGEVTRRFQTLFMGLQTEIADVFQDKPHPELRSAITEAFTQVQTVLHQVSDWFHMPSNEELQSSFSMDEIIDVAIGITEQTHKSRRLHLNRHIDVARKKGADVLSEIVDIMFIVFGNIHRHSGVQDCPVVDVHVTEDDANLLTLRIESEVGDNAIAPDAEERMDRIRHIIGSGEFSNFTRREGGSGLVKIMRTISVHEVHKLDFGLHENKFFVQVQMSLNYAGGIVEEEKSELQEHHENSFC